MSTSYSKFVPSLQLTVFCSGSIAAAAFLIHVAPLGITEDSARSVDDALACPPPTRVHSGW